MPCRIFYMLLERLEPLEKIYTAAVEPVMGHPRHRETAAQLRLMQTLWKRARPWPGSTSWPGEGKSVL